MARQPRLDIPGVLQHVMVRGIERSKIFLDDEDRADFVGRFSRLLAETATDCFAWALIPNHFHLLLRCNRLKLSGFMRRLLTGYAVTFNLRHTRSGHLFQNRYKSIICEEEPYLLELIRYIHLNPVRAGLVSNLDGLEHYRWCGHGVFLGYRAFSGQASDEVLNRFGNRLDDARQNYRQFVADGLAMGKRPDLTSSERHSAVGTNEPPEDRDNRILGSGEFVRTLKQIGNQENLQKRISLDELQKQIQQRLAVPPEVFLRRGRQNEASQARALFCFLAVTKLQYSGSEIGSILGIGDSSVSRAVGRGAELFQSRGALQLWWQELLMQ
jgi:REP element-mobilizing transposase RayT